MLPNWDIGAGVKTHTFLIENQFRTSVPITCHHTLAIAWLLKQEVPIAASSFAKHLLADLITQHPGMHKGA